MLQFSAIARSQSVFAGVVAAEPDSGLCGSNALGLLSRITHFEGRVIGLFHGLPAGISRAL